MLQEQHEQLNRAYRPLHESYLVLRKSLRDLGIETDGGWYNNHYRSFSGEYDPEYYPIPVITISGMGDVILDFDHFACEITVSREKAVSMDFLSLSERFSIEVYGVKDYLLDFYRSGMEAEGTAGRILESNEKEFHIAVTLDNGITGAELIQIFHLFGK